MIRLDAATVLLQWAVGGLLFLWVTTRRREVGIGYGWLLRGVYAVLAVGAVAAGRVVGGSGGPAALVRDAAGSAVALAALVALAVSVLRRRAGVAGERERLAVRSSRVEAMTGIARHADGPRSGVPEFPPALDLVAPILGSVGLVAAGLADAVGGAEALSVLRVVVGALFLGAISDAMLLGHWYLVQPGLGRAPLHELNRWSGVVWPFEVALLLVPTGMLSVLGGSIDDGYGGLLGWFWVACALTTIGLVVVTQLALRERAYSAVMAATGLLYLAILTAFGTDLVARAVLAGA
ncbi:MAG TPA: hypothetical protein VM933_03585 [Acidimicrobiales bacterium]|nr:hypothetical protein [Acidimicrobiales bacterium]